MHAPVLRRERAWIEWVNRIPILNRTLLVILIVVAWQFASRNYQSYILPSPLVVLQSFGRASLNPDVWRHLWTSLVRVFAGFGLASVLGIFAGLTMSTSAFARNQILHLFRMMQPIPGIAWIGLTIIWFGMSEAAIIAVITLTVLPVVTLSTYEGFRTVDPEYVRAARTLGARTNWHVFRYVTLPAALPHVLNGLNMGLANGWRVLAGAEMLGSMSGLGYWMQLNAIALRTENVFVVLVFFAAVMVLFEEGIYKPVQRKMLGRWMKA